jgi:hypothetical protein
LTVWPGATVGVLVGGVREKLSVVVFTVSEKLLVRVTPPPVALTVTVCAPVAMLGAVLIDNVTCDGVEPFGVTVDELKLQDTPEGGFAQLSVTAEVKPLAGVIVTVIGVAEAPAFTVAPVGAMEMVNGDTTFTTAGVMDEDDACDASPRYVATTLSSPAGKELVVKVAVPLCKRADPNAVLEPLLKKPTDPTAPEVTVAVKVMLWLTSICEAEDEIVVVVALRDEGQIRKRASISTDPSPVTSL